MPQPSLSHPVRLQPPYASSWSLMWPEIVSRDPQLRTERVLCIWLASLGPLVGSVVEELKDSNLVERFTCRRGPRSVDLWLVWSALNACFNVDTCASPAHSARIYVPATRSVGLNLIGDRERAW